jgi:hypothetical protein
VEGRPKNFLQSFFRCPHEARQRTRQRHYHIITCYSDGQRAHISAYRYFELHIRCAELMLAPERGRNKVTENSSFSFPWILRSFLDGTDRRELTVRFWSGLRQNPSFLASTKL